MSGEQWTEFDRAVGGNPLIGRVTSRVGDRTLVATVEVDMSGREVRTVDPYGVVVTTLYDERTGEPATVTTAIPGAPTSVTQITYDQHGWIEEVAVDGRSIEKVEYRPDGLVAKSTAGNGVVSTLRYDERLRLTAVVRTTPTGETFESSVEVSAGGHVSANSLTANAQTSTFVYTHDEAGRLQKAEVSAGLLAAARTWEYTYDDNSNRLSQLQTINGATTGDYTYEYDSADRLVATNDPAAADGLEYDDRGNATRVGPNRFTYDAANQVTHATDGTATVTFDRGVAGSLLGRTVQDADGIFTIVYAANGVLLDGDGQATVQRYPISGGVYTRPITPGAPARWEFNTIDGDLFVVTDDVGATVGEAQVYDPFGVRLSDPVPPRTDMPNLTWQAATGNETLDLDTPFVLMGARVYIPALGRFIQVDPKVGGSSNGYDYAAQNPVNLSDPSGESFLDWLPTIVGAVASLAIGAVIPPASGYLLGAVVGAMVNSIAFGITWAVEQSIHPDTEFSVTQLGISLLVGAIGGAAANRIRTAATVRQLKSQLAEVNLTYEEWTKMSGPLRSWKDFAKAKERVAFVRNRPSDLFDQVGYFDSTYKAEASSFVAPAKSTVSYRPVSADVPIAQSPQASVPLLARKSNSIDLSHHSVSSHSSQSSSDSQFVRNFVLRLAGGGM
jgi:RHS repeat-associated protein